MATLAALGLVDCGTSPAEPSALSRQAIVDGTVWTGDSSPFLYLSGPEGTCTSTLVAPTLVVTARHCVAQWTDGNYTCGADGNLIVNGTAAGELGADNAPSSLKFFTAAQVASGQVTTATPVAIGVQVVSTQSPTVCRDDLGFVVLDRPIPGVTPVPMRLTSPTVVGEMVSVWGYGLTSANDPLNLRVRSGISIEGIGPDTPVTEVQPTPVRSVRIGPYTCQGDSGGPIQSMSTGALVAVVSIGAQAGQDGPFCTATEDTTGPRLADYEALADTAFAAAGSPPNLEGANDDAGITIDAAVSDLVEASVEAASQDPRSDGGGAPGCTLLRSGPRGSTVSFDIALAGLAALAVRRRRKR